MMSDYKLMPECKMAGGENEIGDSVYCFLNDTYVAKEDCRGNCESYLPHSPEDL